MPSPHFYRLSSPAFAKCYRLRICFPQPAFGFKQSWKVELTIFQPSLPGWGPGPGPGPRPGALAQARGTAWHRSGPMRLRKLTLQPLLRTHNKREAATCIYELFVMYIHMYMYIYIYVYMYIYTCVYMSITHIYAHMSFRTSW